MTELITTKLLTWSGACDSCADLLEARGGTPRG